MSDLVVTAVRWSAAVSIIFLMAAMVFESAVSDLPEPQARRARRFATFCFILFVVLLLSALGLVVLNRLELPA